MGGVSGYSVETVFVSQFRKKLWRNPSTFQKISSVGKNLRRRDGVLFLFVENFLSHSAENFRRGTIQCFIKIGVSKKIMHKEGKTIFSVEFFCSHSAGKKSVLQKFLVSKNFIHRTGGIIALPKIFCFT